VPLEELIDGEDLTYQEYPVKILDTSEKLPGITATRCVKCSGVIILKKKPLGKKKVS
jgi:DNA-directed RNA polymerase subunit RPC12/RpoP